MSVSMSIFMDVNTRIIIIMEFFHIPPLSFMEILISENFWETSYKPPLHQLISVKQL